jgi:hypothetical protein
VGLRANFFLTPLTKGTEAMGRKYVLLDDLTGDELPDSTEPIHLSLGRTTYALYLSEDSHGKLLEAVQPFIENAETVSQEPSRGTARSSSTAASSSSAADKERLKKIRAWAQSTNYKYKNAKGDEVTLGDRGRIPEEVIKAYTENNPDD